MAKLNINASQALAEIRKLVAEINQLKAASKSMSSATKANFNNIESSITDLRSKVGLLNNELKYMEAIVKKQNATLAKNTSATKSNSKAKNSNTDSTDKAAKSQKNYNRILKDLVAGGFLLKAGQLAKQLAENVYENIKTFDSLSFTLEKITKNTFDYENSQRFLLRITEAYGVELVATTKRWSRFLAAANESGLALRETEEIFESMTKASAALGLGTDDLSSVYLALEQMLSKGKVSTEELRRQLGEKLPGAMGIMAASMGVTIPVLDKMLKKGEVLSAEVLPNFARAVEKAYGIENATRIETLIAKQNRLGAAWQRFIKNVSEGDGIIKRVLGGLLDFLTETVDLWDKMFLSDNQKLRVQISVEEEDFKNALEKSAKDSLEKQRPVSEQDISLNSTENALLERMKTATNEERKIIGESLEKIAFLRVKKDKEVLASSKETAKERVKIAYAEFKEAESIYNKINTQFKEVKSGERIKSDYNQGDKDVATANLVRLTAAYNVYRKLIEESEVSFIPNEEQTGKTMTRLRAIRDYSLEIINEIAGHVRDSNLDMFEDETLNLSDRLNALKTAVKQEILIEENLRSIKQKNIEDTFNQEVAAANLAVSKGTLSAEKAAAHIIALEKEKQQQLVLIAQQTGNKIASINIDAAEKVRQAGQSFNEETRIGGAEDFFNKRIAAAKADYEASKKTAADKEALEKRLAKVAIDSTNEIIDIKIDLLNQEIIALEASGTATSEYIAKLKRDINSLKASKVIDPPVDADDWKEQFEEAMKYASQFNDAVGGIVDGLFARKIENIEAEIKAEEDKYDRLIALAQGDEEQQATLQRNKEDRIRRLEAKRLKETQKQARANKALAIADIAINTAVAISKTLAQGGAIFGIPLVPIIAALGALQTAAVLAAPIPKYKDGVDNLGEDQIAMINDGSYQEYVERNGRILSTTKKNAIVGLEKGDTVYRNYEDMAARSNLFKIKNKLAIEKFQNDQLLNGITGAIKKGYKGAKISNTINLKNKSDNSSYARQMSRWN